MSAGGGEEVMDQRYFFHSWDYCDTKQDTDFIRLIFYTKCSNKDKFSQGLSCSLP